MGSNDVQLAVTDFTFPDDNDDGNTNLADLNAMKNTEKAKGMRIKLTCFFLFGLLFFINNSISGEVNLPINFQSGNVLTATQLNQNFSSIKTEIDDNSTKIQENIEKQQSLDLGIKANADKINEKQALLQSECPSGKAIYAIAADGTISCEDVKKWSGSTELSDRVNAIEDNLIKTTGDLNLELSGSVYMFNGSNIVQGTETRFSQELNIGDEK